MNKNWIKQMFCQHLWIHSLGYGIFPTFNKKVCMKCGKVKND